MKLGIPPGKIPSYAYDEEGARNDEKCIIKNMFRHESPQKTRIDENDRKGGEIRVYVLIRRR